MARALDDDPVAVGAVVVPFLEIGIDDLAHLATIPQLGFVLQAAAVNGVLKTLAAARTWVRDSNRGLLARQIGSEHI